MLKRIDIPSSIWRVTIHSINLVHKHVALLFLSPFIIPISWSSCVIRLTSRLLLNCLSWVCQFNLALCNMSIVPTSTYIFSSTTLSLKNLILFLWWVGGDIFPWYGILTPLFKTLFSALFSNLWNLSMLLTHSTAIIKGRWGGVGEKREERHGLISTPQH